MKDDHNFSGYFLLYIKNVACSFAKAIIKVLIAFQWLNRFSSSIQVSSPFTGLLPMVFYRGTMFLPFTGSMSSVPQPSVKRMRLDDVQNQTQGTLLFL